MDDDENAPLKFEPGRRIGQRWEVIEKLDEGGFGQVYKVKDLQNPAKFAALKVEPADMEGGSAIKLEMNVLDHMNKKSQSAHFPMIFTAKKHKKYCYMVMELLGRNLKVIKSTYSTEAMPVSDWCRLAMQCLHSIKTMHDRGFVHRDIKPSNFVLGYSSDFSKARIVHVLDFGLARAYAFLKGQRWEARKARTHIDFRGTFRYASPNMHRAEDLGRRDDLYSLIYMFIELHCGLPWQKDKEKEVIELKKLYMEDNPKDLVANFPNELHGVLPHLKTLTYYSRPNYMMMYNGLLDLMKKANVKMTDKYEWETEEEYKSYRAAEGDKRKCICEEEKAMIISDPIRINAPPTNFAVDNSNTREDFNNMKKNQEVATGTEGSKREQAAPPVTVNVPPANNIPPAPVAQPPTTVPPAPEPPKKLKVASIKSVKKKVQSKK